ASPPPPHRYRGVPDSPNLSSALGETVSQGRQFVARVASLAGAISAQLEEHERAGHAWAGERQTLQDEDERRKGQVDALNGTLAALRPPVHRLGPERAAHQALQARHAELTEQSNKLAGDWATRRQALAAEIAAQNEEMEQIRKAMLDTQDRDRRVVSTPPVSLPVAAPNTEQSHLINSRLNTLVGFSSVLLDERAHALTAEERREYVKYLHDSAVKLSETVRALTGARSANAESNPPVVDHDRRPPDILVADNDANSRQRIEPFLKRAGYE